MTVVGLWRIVDMEAWEQDAVDLVAPGFFEFEPDSLGRLGFIAVQGGLDWREGRDGRPGVAVVSSCIWATTRPSATSSSSLLTWICPK